MITGSIMYGVLNCHPDDFTITLNLFQQYMYRYLSMQYGSTVYIEIAMVNQH